ncbi:hypothetical protein QE152_g14178 [Popillia japonica]|uniref:Uncharacterized protein n=1 Tax=Popillia japonica TaxID=7064 RepID=A0AAW1L8X5_POPJA
MWNPPEGAGTLCSVEPVKNHPWPWILPGDLGVVVCRFQHQRIGVIFESVKGLGGGSNDEFPDGLHVCVSVNCGVPSIPRGVDGHPEYPVLEHL